MLACALCSEEASFCLGHTHTHSAKSAADLIGSSELATVLAKIDRSAAAISKGDKMFFGQEPAYLPNVLLKGDMGAG